VKGAERSVGDVLCGMVRDVEMVGADATREKRGDG